MAEAGLRGWLVWALLLLSVSLVPVAAPVASHWGWQGLLGDSGEGLGWGQSSDRLRIPDTPEEGCRWRSREAQVSRSQG